jgi:hypothetical protein
MFFSKYLSSQNTKNLKFVYFFPLRVLLVHEEKEDVKDPPALLD